MSTSSHVPLASNPFAILFVISFKLLTFKPKSSFGSHQVQMKEIEQYHLIVRQNNCFCFCRNRSQILMYSMFALTYFENGISLPIPGMFNNTLNSGWRCKCCFIIFFVYVPLFFFLFPAQGLHIPLSRMPSSSSISFCGLRA